MLSFFAVLFLAVVSALHCATYLLWHYERCRSGSCRSRLTGADLGPWIAEGLALAAVAATWPLGLIRWARPPTGSSGRPILLVPGWGLNSASMALLAARLRRDGRVVQVATFAWRSIDLPEAAETLVAQLRRVVETTASPTVDVVAYGLGGVLVRIAAQSSEVSTLLGNVVTIATPHRGTALACLGVPRMLGVLRPGSPFLGDLVRDEKLPVLMHLAAIASPFDAIVFPFDLAYCPAAFNVTVERVGHFSMLYSDRVYPVIAENLGVPGRKATT
jgi:triacylglycerol lipase